MDNEFIISRPDFVPANYLAAWPDKSLDIIIMHGGMVYMSYNRTHRRMVYVLDGLRRTFLLTARQMRLFIRRLNNRVYRGDDIIDPVREYNTLFI